MQNTIQHVHQSDTYVWNTATLMWVPAQQALVKTDTLTVTGDVTDRAGRLLGHVTVDNFPATQPMSAVALPLPVGAATAARQDIANTSLGNLDVALSTRTKPADQQHVIVDSSASIAVTGPLTDALLRASAVPVSLAVAPSTPVTNAGLTNIDVALSTRLKPADTLAAVTTLGSITSAVHIDDNAGSLTVDSPNLDVALSTRLKPADTLAGVTTVAAVTSITNPVAVTGPLTDTQLRATRVPVDPSGVTSPVSAVSLPLPSGAAVESGGALERVSTRIDVTNRLAHLSLLAALAASPNGFVPAEVPSFLVG